MEKGNENTHDEHSEPEIVNQENSEQANIHDENSESENVQCQNVEQGNSNNFQLVPVPSTQEVSNLPDWAQKAPKSLNELLIQTTAMSGEMSATDAANLRNQDNDEEAKRHLRRVLDECFSEGSSVIKRYFDIIKNGDKNDTSGMLIALQQIQFNVGPIDLATDFYKMGGLEVLKPLMEHSDCKIRQVSIQIIKECCSNNPYCQEHSFGDDVLGQLISIAFNSLIVEEQIKAISAISAIIRGNITAMETFNKHNGFSLLKKTLDSENTTLLERTTTLISAAVTTDFLCGGLIVNQGIVQRLIALVVVYQKWEAEFFVRTLIDLFYVDGGTRDICLNDTQLRSHLEDILHSREGMPQYEELMEYARELLKLMNTYQQEKKEPYPT